MNIRTYLSWVKDFDEKVIEQIEIAIGRDLPFGLGCSQSLILFVPSQLKAFWLWSDLSPGPHTVSANIGEFMTTLRGQYQNHKEFITTTEVLEIIKQINERKELGTISGQNVPESTVETGPVETSDGGVQPGGITECETISEFASGKPASIVLSESVRDAKIIPFYGSQNSTGDGG